MKKLKINKRYSYLLLFTICIVTAFSFLKSSAVSSQKNEIKTNPDTEFNITYELDGGKFEDGVTAPTKYKYIEETTIPNPVKEGSEFLGWTINDKTDTEPVKDYTIPKGTIGDVKLTANWKLSSSMLVNGVTFNSNVKAMSGFSNITKIVFNGIIPSDIASFENIDVSKAKDKSIMAYINGDTLNVVSNGEIIANPTCSYMFYDWKSLENVDVSNFNTSSVTTMYQMFAMSYAVTNIVGLENFDTSQVTNMASMFSGCQEIMHLDLSGWNTSNVNDMKYMFHNCNSLTNIVGLENFDTSQVINMTSMFGDCHNLNGTITISTTIASSYYYTNMFRYCSKYSNTKFIVKYIDDKTKEVARQMVETKLFGDNVFLYEEPSTLVDGQTFNSKIKAMSGFTNVTDIRFIQGTSNVTGTDVSEAQNRSIVAYIDGNILYVVSENEIFANSDCSYMFNGLNNITNIDFTYNFNTDNVTNMGRMFWYCKLLTSLDLSKFNTSKVTDMHMLFSNCSSLTRLNLSSFNTSNVTDMGSMFYGCKKLSSLDLSNFKTLKVTNMDTMFCYCENLTKLDLSGFNTSQVTNMSNMFNECWRLNSIKGIEIFNTSKVTNMSEMFKSCHNLNGEITIMNPNISEYKNMFFNCSQRVTGQPEYKFIVNYASGCKEVAQNMVDTKSEISNVELGTQKSLLNNDEDLDEENTIPDTLILTIKDGREVSTKEITDRVIGSLESPVKEGKVFVGYFYDVEYTKPVSEKDVISEDTTIYIKWEEIPQVEEIPQEEENKDESLKII